MAFPWSLESCDFRMGMKVYDYVNSTYAFTATLFVRSDGKVSYESFGNTTDWHGSWNELDDDRAVTTFNCKGDVEKMKTAILMKARHGGWFGIDHMRNFIHMTLMFQCGYCNECGCWCRIEDPNYHLAC